MKNLKRIDNKNFSLAVLISSLLLIILLAASLSNLELQPGIAFQGTEDGVLPDRPAETIITEGSPIIFILQGIFSLAFFAFCLYIIVRLIVYVDFKTVGVAVLAVAIILAVLYLVPESKPGTATYPQNQYAISPTSTSSLEAGELTGSSLGLLIWLLVIPTLIGFGIIVFKMIQDRSISSPHEPDLLHDAEEAVHALEAGLDFNDVITRCYFQMTATLQEEQGIERHTYMTVREFEDALTGRGYPPGAVHQLTALFEKIRYGEIEKNVEDEANALNSLNEIIQFARKEGERSQ